MFTSKVLAALYGGLEPTAATPVVPQMKPTSTRAVRGTAAGTSTMPPARGTTAVAMDDVSDLPEWLMMDSQDYESVVTRPRLRPLATTSTSKPIKPTSISRTASKTTASTSTEDPASAPAAKAQPKAPKAKAGPRVKPVDPLDALIPTLPVYSHADYSPAPTVVYTRDEEEANDLVGALSGPLGFDLEWKVTWGRRGVPPTARRTALVQVADKQMVLLVQVSAMKRFPENLKEIIESADIVKTGANIKNDGEKLLRDFGILPRGLVELGALALAADGTAFPYTRAIVSLAKMVALYTGKQLLKDNVRTSDWERPLSAEQIQYAANDAHCALMAYNRLLEIAKAAETVLEPAKYTTDLRAVHEARRAAAVPSTATTPSTSTASTDTAASSSAASAASTMPSTPTAAAAPLAPAPALSQSGRTASAGSTGSGARPRHKEAYDLWHVHRLALPDICARMRPEAPLKDSTVISYVVGALQADPNLPYERDRLRTLVKAEPSSWARHKKWLLSVDH